MGRTARTSPLTDPLGPPQGMVRFTIEAVVLLGIAVSLFRTFFAEGYMISTGSMAPSLLGFHRQVCCPACEFRFARGAAAGGEGSAAASIAADAADPWEPTSTRCPNCGSAVPDAAVPRTEGDQLMVHKHHYELRNPQRWEVVVFRNPLLPTQAYVKRIVGLPGETLELIDGDVYADGVLQRKPLEVQRALRIPVDSFDHQPPADDPDWRPRWRVARPDSDWRTDGTTLRIRPAAAAQVDAAADHEPIDWLEYRHWVRDGGSHRCRTPLAVWPSRVAEPSWVRDRFRYDAAAKELESIGAIPHTALARWQERLTTDEARQALEELYERSHRPLLSDVCAYNHPDAATAAHPVHDLLLEATLTARRRQGAIVFALHDGCHELQCRFDLARGEAIVTADGKPTRHRAAPLPERLLAGEPALVTMSQFDRQLLVAVDGEELFEPLLYAGDGARPALPEVPVRIGAAGADAELSGLRLDRDVYYTSDDELAGRQFPLGADEFFVLGDNSPVSLDSRAWAHAAMPRSLLIGKPFVVHLPSRSQVIEWQGRQTAVRVPDFSRVRYIR